MMFGVAVFTNPSVRIGSFRETVDTESPLRRSSPKKRVSQRPSDQSTLPRTETLRASKTALLPSLMLRASAPKNWMRSVAGLITVTPNACR